MHIVIVVLLYLLHCHILNCKKASLISHLYTANEDFLCFFVILIASNVSVTDEVVVTSPTIGSNVEEVRMLGQIWNVLGIRSLCVVLSTSRGIRSLLSVCVCVGVVVGVVDNVLRDIRCSLTIMSPLTTVCFPITIITISNLNPNPNPHLNLNHRPNTYSFLHSPYLKSLPQPHR